ncbi:MAG: rhodanese-like domain-containing protein [Chloroflexota bacterium]|nr:rhodanese-like domain-containing protein [Chloroflexota bacterium]
MTHPTSLSTTAIARRTGLLAGLLMALALAAAACGSAGPAATAAPAASTPAAGAPAALAAEVSVDEASRLRDAGAFMLDVREPDEWAAGHIEGATLIPLGELAARANEVPADRQVVVVCRSGNRSAQGRDVLLGAGLPSVTSMAGGMNDWAGSGKPVVTGS